VEHFMNWMQKQEDVQKLWVESSTLIATEICYAQNKSEATNNHRTDWPI
jgi:hypothetical protein